MLQIEKDWRNIAQDRDEWNAVIEKRVIELNMEAEELEKLKKDELKEGGKRCSWRHR